MPLKSRRRSVVPWLRHFWAGFCVHPFLPNRTGKKRAAFPAFRCLAGFLFLLAVSSRAATFTVTSTNDSGLNTLRWAVTNANLTPGTNTIAFALTGTAPFTINLATALPSLTNAVVVDGTTQAGYADHPLVVLKGNNFGSGTNGLRIQGGNSVVRGLAIGGFYDAIRLETNGNNIVQGNFLGTDASGTNAVTNGEGGVVVNRSANNLIGGTNATERNVIGANAVTGIWIFGDATVTNNRIVNNLIGVKWTGTNALNNGTGILLQSVPANLILSNVISGNTNLGVDINSSGANGNVIQGNFIGTDSTGLIALPNFSSGIAISSGLSNLVGGTAASLRNVISGNGAYGVQLINASSNTISGNFIGVDATGINALANGSGGIILTNAAGNWIGGGTAGAHNVISGNTNYGLYLFTGATGNLVQGNFVGTDATGTHAVANRLDGIRIDSGTNTIGGALGSTGNLISGNGGSGVYLAGTNAAGNQISGNLIGTDVNGTSALPNVSGVFVTNAPGNTIGGTTGSARNILSGNSANGVRLLGNRSVQNRIIGNYVGADITGYAGVGNAKDGIAIQDLAVSNYIGGTVAGAGNLISANGTAGYLSGIFLTNVSGTIIQGNRIGTKADGISPLGNTSHGVEISMGSSNVIGGTAAGAGNTIAYAGPTAGLRSGVRIRNPVPGGSVGNLISGNLIFSNSYAGIDLEPFGANTNVSCNAGTSTNANKGQNYPVLTVAVSDGASVGIKGTLNSTASTSFRVQFFANPTCSSGVSGYGQGQIFLGEGTVLTDGSCNASFTASIGVAVPPGYFITATATDPANNTSEFSPCATVSNAPSLSLRQLTPAPSAQLAASWPTSPAGFVLKQTTNLAPPVVWTTATNAVVANGSTNTATISVGTGAQFFRLSFE